MPHLIRLATLALALAGSVAPAAQAQTDEDPALQQRIDADQRIAEGRAVLAAGHVDLGPRFVDDRWTLMVHDDSGKADGRESVWRRAEQTVLRVTDAGRLRAPEDPTYAFLRVEPGDPVHVVPETQDRDVVWVGWNTQDPEVMQLIDRGATMTMTDVQGPGSLVVYLQSGSFSDPKVLWDSEAKPNPVWLDVNTHTHANWVFTKPGTYLVRLRIEAELLDGRKVSDTRDVRFAVGSRTSTGDALAARWRGPAAPVATVSAGAPAASAPAGGADDGGQGLLIAAIALAAAGLGGATALVVVRGDRTKRRARDLQGRGRA